MLRFDLLEKCKPARLAKELADPADGTGTTPAQPLSAKLGQKMPLGGFELSVDSFATGVATCDGKAPKAGAQWVLVTATVRNLVPTEERFSHTSIKPTLVSGETAIKGKYLLLQTGVDAVLASSVLAPGATRSFRWAFEAPTELTTPKLHLEWQATDRKAVLDLVAP
ncbi:MAG: hypothetical protein HZB16_05015 [Armatimonadetes bacterium]|nr:hypothetical protein [Armatimonadota bacterium]